MAERKLTDAWGDRWDVVQEGTMGGHVPEHGPIRFRHQSGREVTITPDQRLDSMTDNDLLRVLDAVLEREGEGHSVTRGIDAKADAEGYANPRYRPG